MRHLVIGFGMILGLGLVACAGGGGEGKLNKTDVPVKPVEAKGTFAAVKPILQHYCLKCHRHFSLFPK